MKSCATWLFLLSMVSFAAAGCASNRLGRDASSDPVHYGWPEPDTGTSRLGIVSEG